MAIAGGQRSVVEGVLGPSALEALRLHRGAVWSLLDELERLVPFATGEQRGPDAAKRLAVALASLADRLGVSAIEMGRLQRSSVPPSGPSAPPSVDEVRPAWAAHIAEAVDSAAE